MKITSKICGVTRIPGTFGRPRLEVAVERIGSFTVADTAVARRTYAIGRLVTVTITPGRAR